MSSIIQKALVLRALTLDYTHADYQALSVYLANVNLLALFANVLPSDVNAVCLFCSSKRLLRLLGYMYL